MLAAGERTMSKLKQVFARAVFLLTACVAAASAADAPEQGAAPRPLVAGVWIAGQISPRQVAEFEAQGIKTIVDLRPDGEAADQPASRDVEAAARAAGLGFAYAPVAGEIPSSAVDAVARAIMRPDKPVLIYCKSGRRAARTWALAEASRKDGLEAEAIESVVKSAGQSVDDLKEQIAARIATRSKLP